MPAIGGSFIAVGINGRNFVVAADSDGTRSLGGPEITVEANGDGQTARPIRVAKTWSMEDLNLEIDDTRGDQEYLETQRALNDFIALDFTEASGVVYQGQGQITGEIKRSTQSATASVSFMGPGQLTQQ